MYHILVRQLPFVFNLKITKILLYINIITHVHANYFALTFNIGLEFRSSQCLRNPRIYQNNAFQED